jgi:hypothetical protein
MPLDPKTKDRIVTTGVVIAVLVLFLPVVLPFFPSIRIETRGPSGRLSCLNNQKNVTLALMNYASQNDDTLPPPYIADENGKPMHSWRVLLLPLLDQRELYNQYRFDEPWNGPNNSKLAKRMPRCYACPDRHTKNSTTTNYLLPVGPNAAFTPGVERTLDEISKADGQGNTILILCDPNSNVNWLEPRDFEVETADLKALFKSAQHERKTGYWSSEMGLHIFYADGLGGILPATTPVEVLKALFTFNGGEVIPKEYQW